MEFYYNEIASIVDKYIYIYRTKVLIQNIKLENYIDCCCNSIIICINQLYR